MQKQQTVAVINKIVKFIREYCDTQSGCPRAQVILNCEIGSSTLYAYNDIIFSLFPDIKYRNKQYFVEGFQIQEREIERENR